MRNVPGKSCRENQNTNFTVNTFSENRAVYGIMFKNILEPDKPQMTIERMRITCWIPKITDISSEYVIKYSFST